MRSQVMEFIGTMFPVVVIGLTGDPLAIGVMLMVMVYLIGPFPGGALAAIVFKYLNPEEV